MPVQMIAVVSMSHWKSKQTANFFKNRIKFAIALENACRQQINYEAESKMLERESDVN